MMKQDVQIFSPFVPRHRLESVIPVIEYLKHRDKFKLLRLYIV